MHLSAAAAVAELRKSTLAVRSDYALLSIGLWCLPLMSASRLLRESQFTPPRRTRQNCLVCVASDSAVWTGFPTTRDCRRQKIWSSNTFGRELSSNSHRHTGYDTDRIVLSCLAGGVNWSVVVWTHGGDRTDAKRKWHVCVHWRIKSVRYVSYVLRASHWCLINMFRTSWIFFLLYLIILMRCTSFWVTFGKFSDPSFGQLRKAVLYHVNSCSE